MDSSVWPGDPRICFKSHVESQSCSQVLNLQPGAQITQITQITEPSDVQHAVESFPEDRKWLQEPTLDQIRQGNNRLRQESRSRKNAVLLLRRRLGGSTLLQERINAPINASIKHVACLCFGSEAKILATDDTRRNNSAAGAARTRCLHDLQSHPDSRHFVLGRYGKEGFGFYGKAGSGAAEGL